MPNEPILPWHRRGWTRWIKVATVIGDFQARVVLSLFYFLIVLPFGLAVRLFADPRSDLYRKKKVPHLTDYPETSLPIPSLCHPPKESIQDI